MGELGIVLRLEKLQKQIATANEVQKEQLLQEAELYYVKIRNKVRELLPKIPIKVQKLQEAHIIPVEFFGILIDEETIFVNVTLIHPLEDEELWKASIKVAHEDATRNKKATWIRVYEKENFISSLGNLQLDIIQKGRGSKRKKIVVR